MASFPACAACPSCPSCPVCLVYLLSVMNEQAGRWECSRQRSDQRPSENLSLHELQSRKCHPQPGPSGEAPNHLWADISEAGCSEASDVPARQAGHDDPKCPEGARVTGGGSSSSQQAAGCGEGGLPARRPSSTSSRFFGPHERLSSRRAAGGRVIPSAPDSVKGSAGAADSPPDEAGGAQVTGATHGTTAAVNHFSRHGMRSLPCTIPRASAGLFASYRILRAQEGCNLPGKSALSCNW